MLAINIVKKLLDSAKTSGRDAIKTASKRATKKTSEATGDLIGKKIADKITSVSKKIFTNYFKDRWEWNKNIQREIYISRKKIAYYWWTKINMII